METSCNPDYAGRVGPRATASERGEALEAVGLGRRLTSAQIRALLDAGCSVRETPPPQDRPWGEEDRAVILRLARTRGWSALAISVFLQRPEAQVKAILSGARPEDKAGPLRAHRRVPRLPHGAARWGAR